MLMLGVFGMASSFELYLDTTSPNIRINAPQKTTYNIHTYIVIESNELLMEYQDIYIIDGNGTRHDVTFLYQDDKYFGDIVFNETYSIGIATIYARLKDSVGNLSELASATFNIVETKYMILDIIEFSMISVSYSFAQDIKDIIDDKFNSDVFIYPATIDLSIATMDCDIEERVVSL